MTVVRRAKALGVYPFLVVGIAALALSRCSNSQPTSSTPTTAAPGLASPADDALTTRRPTLSVNNVATSGTGPRTYDFQVADSQTVLTASTGTPPISVTGIAEGAIGQTSYTIDQDLQLATRYYWRARVVQGGVTGAWSNPFRFRTDVAVNNPPVIQSLTLSSPRVEVNTEVGVQAVVQDQETSPANLTYEWSSTVGSFSGTGASVRFRAPASSPPVLLDLTLTVIERYMVTGADGVSQTRENRTVGTIQVHVNDSANEITTLGATFIDDFLHSDRPAELCVRNFSDSCPGKAAELIDTNNNRAQFVNDPSRSSFIASSVAFYQDGSRRTVVPAGQANYGVLLAACRFYATNIRTGVSGTAVGTCELTAVYENFQWFLCDSHFLNPSGALMAAGFRFGRQ